MSVGSQSALEFPAQAPARRIGGPGRARRAAEADPGRQVPGDRRHEHLSFAAIAATRVASWTVTPITSSPTSSVSPVWTAARIDILSSRCRIHHPLCATDRLRRTVEDDEEPSPVISTSRPRNAVTTSRIRVVTREEFPLLPPRRVACPVESTMSVSVTTTSEDALVKRLERSSHPEPCSTGC